MLGEEVGVRVVRRVVGAVGLVGEVGVVRGKVYKIYTDGGACVFQNS